MNFSNFSFEGNVIKTEKFSKELDYPIQDIIYLEDKQCFIVLYDMGSNIRKWGQFPNIICFNSKGEKIWTVELPTTDTGDSYFRMQFKNGKLIADSWCSFSCEIDVNTGKIKEAIFFK
ncbi:MAG: hypothetical protein K2X02_08660 [Alphaproteobacteria bacterium]|nr:hypothetical protein [Alphaproteobacteria bacterium]